MRYRFLIPFIAAMIMSESYFSWQEMLNKHWSYGYSGSFGDCLIYIFQGITEYIPGNGNEFEVPVMYLTINIVIAIFVGSHAVKDLKGFGMGRLIRHRSRLRWWSGACAWNVCCVLKCYLAMYAGVLVMCLIHAGAMDAASPVLIHADVVNRIFEGEADGFTDAGQLLAMTLILPMITSIAVSLAQMTLEFFMIPAASFICVMAAYVLSVFYMKPYMPGNYMMVYRMNQINPDGVGMTTGIVLAVVVSVTAVVVGYVKFRKKDVL